MKVHMIALPLILLLTLFATQALSQEKVRVIDRPTMNVDASCNPNGEATAPLTLRNEGSAAVPLHLSAGDLSTQSPAKHLLISPKLVSKDSIVNPKQEVTVEATVTKLYDDGDWESIIQNDGVDAGSLRIVRTTPPFSVSLDAANADQPELAFVEGQPAHFRLINADPEPYKIAWEYSIDGRIVRSSDPEVKPQTAKRTWHCLWSCKVQDNKATAPTADSVVVIPAGGQKEIIFTPAPRWFGDWFTGLFKDDVADGKLTVALVSPNCPADPPVSKTFKVKTHLATSSGARREGWADAFVFLFLALGGAFSLGLNSLLPNQARRLKAKDQLSKLGSQISNLSYALASRLRVLVGQELRLIKDRLRDLTWTSTDFSGEIQSIEQAMNRLGNRLQFLDGLGSARTNFLRLQADVLPQSVNFALEQIFEKIQEIGEKSDPTDDDVKMALTLISSVQDQLDRGIQGNNDFAKSLATRVKKLQGEFDPKNGRIGKTSTCQRIRVAFPGPFIRLDSEDATTIGPAPDASTTRDYIDLDERLFELERIREYVDLVEGLAPADNLRAKIVTRESDLLGFLGRRSYDAMYDAQLLVRQMNDGYFSDDIQTEVKNGKVRIRTDHGEVRQFEPCEFRLEFLKAALNTAYARQEWICRWTFTVTNGPRPQILTEEGWTVTHYFQEGAKYNLKISITHEIDGTVLPIPYVDIFPGGEIAVIQEERSNSWRAFKALLAGDWALAKKEWRERRRTRKALDYVRLGLALIIALFGLIAGAKEQLLKLDVLPALLAVFMIGFGADQVKNLLAQKSPGTDSSTNTPR
ncbi:MAG TPA: hypothetical protein VNO32_52300 [Candidatus Acidoferrum sp.]|nr:hypothetical protein [Candidatus Acidoferrum sp.]